MHYALLLFYDIYNTVNIEKNGYIGFLDSGAGGFSTLKECLKLLPTENYLYYADVKNAPYGTLSTEKIVGLTLSAVQKMEGFGLNALVIACNTATSAAIEHLRSIHTFPVIGAEPALRPALQSFPDGKILILATPLTISHKRLKNLLNGFDNKDNVIPVCMPALAGLIEKKLKTSSTDKIEIRDYLNERLKEFSGENISAVVLGCTHYCLIKEEIKAVFPDAVLFDGNAGIARMLKKRLPSADNSSCANNCGCADNCSCADNRSFADKAFFEVNQARAVPKIKLISSDKSLQKTYERILTDYLNH
jgi:glutamate racemase